MSTGYTRVTVTSAVRNVELLLPSHRPVGELLPELLPLMGPSPTDSSRPGPGALTLTPTGGPSLTPQESLQEAGIRDGAVLSLDLRDEAVPTPLVYDIAEQTAELTPDSAESWSVDGRRLVGGALVAVLVTSALLLTEPSLGRPALVPLAAAAGLLLLLSLLRQHRLRSDAELSVASAAALAVALVQGLPDGIDAWWVIGGWVAALLTARLLSWRRWSGALITGTAAAGLGVLWWLALLLSPDRTTGAGVAAVGTALLLGLVPRLAMTLSGMSALDDRVAGGARPPVQQADAAVRAAHAGLAAAVVMAALSTVAAVQGLLALGPHPWGTPLALVLISVVALRARSMPWAVERAALLSAAAASAVLAVVAVQEHLPGQLAPAVLAVGALGVLGLRLVEVPDHVTARLRVMARRTETLATITLIPLLVGLFGLYGQLAETFQS